MAEQTDTVIVVGTTEIDEYGNLIVTDKGGGKTKISKKREHLFPIFQQGRAVILHYETYMNKSYVANAKLVEGELPQEPTKVTPATTKPVPVRSYGKSDEEIHSIERQVGFKGAVEIMVAYIRAGRFKDDKPKQIATNTLLIAKEFETHLMSSAKIVEKIEETIEEG